MPATYSVPITELFTQLKSSEKGLSSSEAEQRLRLYGSNELKTEQYLSPWKIIWQQFSSPLIWILLVALIISVFLHENLDAIVIGIIVLLNSILGFVQEYRAEQAIEALKKMASLKAKVLRDGKIQTIESARLVSGDVILIEAGDKVPADARLLEIHDLEVQESSLTGESLPVRKQLTVLAEKTNLAERTNSIFSSTIVTAGRGKAVITQTGMQTEVGKIARLIREAQDDATPLQKKLRGLGKNLTVIVIIVAALVFLVGLFSGESLTIITLTALALAVAAIPEGLPAVITISLALGIQRMVKKNALVRRLPSVETLGSVTVICTDKTGTLTHDQMTVTKIWTNNQVYEVSGTGYLPQGQFSVKGQKVNPETLLQLLKIGWLCNDAKFEGTINNRKVIGDPTEAALLVTAEKAGLKDLSELRLDEIGFTSERKMMTTINQSSKSKVSYTKGAPDKVLEFCSRILINGQIQRLDRQLKREILEQNNAFAKEALRVLAFAYKENSDKENAERDLIFVGLQAMIDPPREEVKEAIQRCHKAGIKVIMITGDQAITAAAIATQLGLPGKVVSGQQIDEIAHLEKEINQIGVFARVDPEHKLKIVAALKKNGHVVAMTGDGINDAPALKKADIGVAMGITGTDVAKEASDMILLDDNFTSIVNAVAEGRGIFDNIRKFINYLLSCNLGEVAVILFASIYGAIVGNVLLPLTAIQILWINLVTDGLPATALSLDPHAPGIMDRPPHSPKENILSRGLSKDIIIFGVLMGLFAFGLFLFYLDAEQSKMQTMIFTSLVLFELVRLQTIRSEYRIKFFSNWPLIAAVVVSFLLHLSTIYTPLSKFFNTTPLSLIDWLFLLGASLGLWLVYESVSYLLNRWYFKEEGLSMK